MKAQPGPINALQHKIILYSTLLYSTLLYYIILYSTLLYDIILYYTIRDYIILYSTLLHSTLLHSTPLYSTLLYSTLLYSTILYHTSPRVKGQLRPPAHAGRGGRRLGRTGLASGSSTRMPCSVSKAQYTVISLTFSIV